jgi:chromatin assembly factor 1 subunit B
MFLDDVEYLSFVRRLSWSPDGNFFLTPASVYQDLLSGQPNSTGGVGTGMIDTTPTVSSSKSTYTVYGFIKSDMTQPAFMLPGIKSYATSIRFNPHLYQKKNDSSPDKPALLDLPYRIVFAVATQEQVLIYSTECVYPIAIVGNLHYASVNDMAWDYSSQKLLTASSDGYISIIQLLPGSHQEESGASGSSSRAAGEENLLG